MFRDSFTLNLAPLLSENFQRILYLWQYEVDMKVVHKEHPDVVIQEIVERKLMNIVPE
jgi:anthranilate/para-aminobenzoate synthase component II